ncbi:MAG: aminopeptidase P family protein [Dysgonamonadaceae bacterium]|jgi:Xaa-Pro aminopeptidase|nr:aminopeptidase P family protein [Dysgonamonadaceae bacterium]
MTVPEKLLSLRQLMVHQKIDACIIPSADPHLSEYPASHWKSRAWLSGFTGSAGTVVVTARKAGLWTDSRYFIQAEAQLDGSGIELFKAGLPETPDYRNWLLAELAENAVIGIDGFVFSAGEVADLTTCFAKKTIALKADFTPFDSLWDDRPVIPNDPLFVLPESFTGAGAHQKISRTLKALHDAGANATMLGSLDMIAWLFNIRGNDVAFNPVAIAYAWVSEKETVLFVNPNKLTPETKDYLYQEGIVIAEYEKILSYISHLTDDNKVLVTPAKINSRICEAIPKSCATITAAVHPVDQLKSIKNPIEIAGFRNAMKKDGIALVRFQRWLEQALTDGKQVTELDICTKLREYRSLQPGYVEDSFETIAGYGAHGAIVHYGVTPESNATLRREGLVLVDSGAHYFDGTTDITRTYALGHISEAMKRDYTLTLKGHISLALACFPKGTVGTQLDILARKSLWEDGLNYLHGTGHGIGHVLNVHEGPQSIRMDYNPTALAPGMITSNEPGVYRANEYGIRIENLVLTVPYQTTPFGEFYRFETLTLCPIDTRPIIHSLLSAAELRWLNDYHRQVYEQLSPELTTSEQIWLKEKTYEL